MIPEIEILPAQAEFIESKETHTAYIGGFGSGKSTAGILKTVAFKLANPGLAVAYYLPTYQLIKDIAFPKFSQILDLIGVKYTLNQSDKEFRTDYGKIIMRSLDNPDLIIGYEVCYSCIDEVDVVPLEKMQNAFSKIVARNRSKTKDGLNLTDMVGTPEGFGFAYNYFVKDKKPNRRLIKVKTTDNPFNSDSYVQSLIDSFSNPQMIEAYINGEFVNLRAGRVYSNFDRKDNHKAAYIEQTDDVLHIGMDFNITNMSAVVHVIRGNEFIAVAELIGIYDTMAMCRTIKDKYSDKKIVIYPDASGKNRNTSGLSDIQMLMNEGFNIRVGNQNPFVRDRVNSMNLAFLNNKGERKYFVNTFNCPEYTQALEQIAYKNNEPDKQSGLDHITDAGGYFIYMVTRTTFTI